MHKTLGTPTSTKIGTLSVWWKEGVSPNNGTNLDTEGDTGVARFLMTSWGDANNHAAILINAGNTMDLFQYNTGYSSQLKVNALFRDVAAWYHLVFAWDTTQGTAANRNKIYINGVEQTYEVQTNYDADDAVSWNASGYALRVGQRNSNGWLDGYMAEACLIDGLALAPTSFGEFDEDSPAIWKPIDVSELTFGNNGFYLDFEDADNLGNDANGGTDLTEVNLAAVDQCTDTPTNNFCTLNPLVRQHQEETGGLKEGNTEVLFSGASWGGISGTMAPAAGKWYFEGKLIANGSNSIIGVVPANTQGKDNTGTWYIGQYSGEQAYQNNGAASNGGASFGNTYTDGDIIGVILDCDNAKVYFSKNGSLENSGDPSSGATGTGAMSLTADKFYTPAVTGNGVSNWEMNFGNGYFGTTSHGETNADDAGIGLFKYDVPAGYYALCTNNLGDQS